MGKRFTETDKWSDPWFRKLEPQFKLAWLYLTDNCDVAGLIDLDEDLANFRIGFDVDWEKFTKQCGPRIHKLASGKLWLPGFIRFQQNGKPLNAANNCHAGIIRRLQQCGINPQEHGFATSSSLAPHEVLTSPSQGASEPHKYSKSKSKSNGKSIGNSNWPYSSKEFLDTWNRWLAHSRACLGRDMPTKTDTQLMQLFAIRDESKAIRWLVHSLAVSDRANLCDPDRYAGGVGSEDHAARLKESQERAEAAERAQSRRSQAHKNLKERGII